MAVHAVLCIWCSVTIAEQMWLCMLSRLCYRSCVGCLLSNQHPARTGLMRRFCSAYLCRIIGLACFSMSAMIRASSPAAVGRMHRPAEVCDLELPLHAQQQILRLDVAVDNMLRMAVQQRPRQGCNVPAWQQKLSLCAFHEHCIRHHPEYNGLRAQWCSSSREHPRWLLAGSTAAEIAHVQCGNFSIPAKSAITY